MRRHKFLYVVRVHELNRIDGKLARVAGEILARVAGEIVRRISVTF